MTEQQRAAILKLIDEAERTLLALHDGPLPQGDLPGLRRALGRAKRLMPLMVSGVSAGTCENCGKPMARRVDFWVRGEVE